MLSIPRLVFGILGMFFGGGFTVIVTYVALTRPGFGCVDCIAVALGLWLSLGGLWWACTCYRPGPYDGVDRRTW